MALFLTAPLLVGWLAGLGRDGFVADGSDFYRWQVWDDDDTGG